MPIGLVSNSDFDSELQKLNGPERKRNRPIHMTIEPAHGRNRGDVNVPESLRKIIGETSVIEGRSTAVKMAGELGISPSSVSAYAKGATSTTTYNEPVKDIIQHINKSRQRAVKKASKTLNSALEAITQEKLDYSDAKDLSGIAKDMAVIIKNLEPDKEVSTDKPTPQFVIYAPQFKQENSFDTIVVNE